MKFTYRLPANGALTDEQLELLRPYLLGEQPREDGEWDMFCPLHEDRERRSAQINVKRGVFHCFASCGGSTVAELIRRKSEWQEPPTAAANGRGRRPGRTRDLPTRATVLGWSVDLLSDDDLLRYLLAERGLWRSTIKQFEIGWDPRGKVYTIPVYDFDGELINVRFYDPHPKGDRSKITSVTGHGGAHLYPAGLLDADEIVVCGGEWDALVTTQYGFPTVTRTASEMTWKPEWVRYFRGKRVYVCHDADDTGLEANDKVARALSNVADVYTVRLPFEHVAKHGKDLTDFWLEHEDDPKAFSELLEAAQPLDQGPRSEPASEPEERPEPARVGIVDTQDGRRLGEPVRVETVVKGKMEPNYSTPAKVRYACDQSRGEACYSCPLFLESGDELKEIPPDDPATLSMIDTPDSMVTKALGRFAGVPGSQCPRLRIDVLEKRSVERLICGQKIDQFNDFTDADHPAPNISVISVGRHDTRTNQAVELVGSLQVNPKDQTNRFMAWDVEPKRLGLENFELDGADAERLKAFQPDSGQRPLAKLRDIVDDLAENVTRIHDRPALHAIIDLVYHSALGFEFGRQALSRGWMEALILGDTRTGKSEAALRLARHYQHGEMMTCERSSIAGIIGGVQQFGTKEWVVTWGALPLNDQQLLILDEAGALRHEDFAEMSGIRSSGIAQVKKIADATTRSRTRAIYIANPRNPNTMEDYTYGVQAIRPFIGANEDIARYDFVTTLKLGEVDIENINVMPGSGDPRFTSDLCSLLVHWVWSRKSEHIVWGAGAQREVLRLATKIGRMYIEDPPLIQATDVKIKLARIAVALACRTFSTRDFVTVDVTRDHVRDAYRFLNWLYGLEGFGYRERSSQVIERGRIARSSRPDARKLLREYDWLKDYLRGVSKFRRQDLEEVGHCERDEANSVIHDLISWGMAYKDKSDVRLTPTMQELLREK